MQATGQDPFRFYRTTREDHYSLTDLSPGAYNWAVAIVRFMRGKYKPVSEESDWYSFEIAPPPVVHSISPTSTMEGTGVTLTVRGEYFMPPLVLTIGVSLPTTFVNTSTITATIPMTLPVGEYPVVVEGLSGKRVSSVFFTVNRGKAVGPTCAPWNPATPIPSVAPPGYDPYAACIVECCAPAPQLIEPANEAEVRYNSTIHLKWTWNYCLPSGWKFAIRISNTYPPHSHHYDDNPKLISCQDGKAVGDYPVGKDFTTKPGIHYWNIAVVRKVEGGWERLSEESEICRFTVVQPDDGDGNGCPVPPCD